MDSIALWFASTLGQYVSKEVVIFIISMIPILELRGGLLVAWSLHYWKYHPDPFHFAVHQEDFPVDEKTALFCKADR